MIFVTIGERVQSN